MGLAKKPNQVYLKKVETSEGLLSEYEQLINGMNDAVYVISFQGKFLQVNEPAIKTLGYTKEEFFKMGPTDIDETLTSAEILQLMEGMKAGERQVFETKHKTKNNALIPVEISSSPVTYRGEQAILSVARNISDRKALEDQLRQSQKMEAIGLLAGGIAHDFNNLLTIINGYSDMLLINKLADNLREPIVQIKNAGERAKRLTSQLLAFSRKQFIQPSIINLNSVISADIKMLRRLLGEDIEITDHLEKELPNINADKSQIEQVILNIAINSRDAMPSGGKLILETSSISFDHKAGKGADLPPGKYVKLSICDTGFGMTDEIKKHLFEPFFTTKGRDKGTGLGLATAYGIIKQSDGYIFATSQLNKGTTFDIYFPAVETGSIENINEFIHKNKLTGTETILVVEDEEHVREVTSRILTSYGYNVVVAGNGLEAFQIYMKINGKIDLVITDIIMPVMSGFELYEKLKNQDAEIKIIFLSGYTDNKPENQQTLINEIVFIQKPYTNTELLKKVREILEK